MSNDKSRNIDVSDVGQNQSIQKDNDTPAKAQFSRNSENSNCERVNVLQHEAQNIDEIASFVASLSEGEENQLVHLLVEQRQWSGLLPDPNTFNQYPEKVQQSILAWNDATILGGSERENKLVDEFIKHRKFAQIFSFLINFTIPMAGITAFVLSGEQACLTSLGIPAVSIAVNIWKDKKEEQEEDQK